MADVKWIKITTTMFDDEKIRLIESMPEKDTILIIWIKLLALCGRCNSNGKILLSGDIAYNEEMLSSIFNRPVSSIRLAIDTFKSFKMIEIEEGVIEISNWHKHQNIDGLDRIRENTRLRVQKFRSKNSSIIKENKSKNKNKRETLPVTHSNVTHFIIPTIDQIKTYCIERGNNIDPQYFLDRNSAVGWCDKNGNKYKDWKAVIRTWEKFSKDRTQEADSKMEERWNKL